MEDEVVQDQNRNVVLFVDDEVEILNSLKRQIQLQDEFSGLFESDPTKVMNIVENNPIDIIVADIVMPELDGITLLAKIKETHPDIIRILLTAHGDYNTSIKAISEADVFGFITKPWEKNYLFGHLKMASKLVNKLKVGVIEKSLPVDLITIISYWDDTKGAEVLSSYPPNVEINLQDIVSRCFMSSSGFFGYSNRFNKTLFSMPLNDIKSATRVYLDNIGGKSFGLVILAKSLSMDQENKVDGSLRKFGENFRLGTEANTISKELYNEIKSYFEYI
jgi:CheY-like chemotaxis protein